MIRVKIPVELEITYDPEVDMCNIYFTPPEKWPVFEKNKGWDDAVPCITRTGRTFAVCDFRREALVGIEVFGFRRLPREIKSYLYNNNYLLESNMDALENLTTKNKKIVDE